MTERTGHERADAWAAQEHAEAHQEGRGCWHCWGIGQGIAAAKTGSIPIDRASGSPRPFDRALGQPESELQATCREILTEQGYVWLGDLSGMEVVPVHQDTTEAHPGLRLELRHRACEARWPQPLDEGISADGANYVANLVERAVRAREAHTCTPHDPSPEHRERVARWTAAAGLTPTGDVAQDQLGIVRALSASLGQPRPGGQLLPDELTMLRRTFGDESAERFLSRRVVDGPGCTPAAVPQPCDGCDDPQCPKNSTEGFNQ